MDTDCGCVTPGGKNANNSEKKLTDWSAELSLVEVDTSLRGRNKELEAAVITADTKEQSRRREPPTQGANNRQLPRRSSSPQNGVDFLFARLLRAKGVFARRRALLIAQQEIFSARRPIVP